MKIILQETLISTIVFTVWSSIITVQCWGLLVGYLIPFTLFFFLFLLYFSYDYHRSDRHSEALHGKSRHQTSARQDSDK